MQRSPVALYTHSREFREYFRGFYVIVFIGILAQNLKYFDEFDFVNLFLSHRPLPLYLSILINYIIPYFYTNVKNRLYHLCDTLVSDLFFPCFIPLYQGSSPVGRCLSSDRLQVWNYAFLGHKKRPGNGFSVTRSGDLPWNCSKRGENAPKNAKMMVYKKRLIDHHTWCGWRDSNPYGLPQEPETCASASFATSAFI